MTQPCIFLSIIRISQVNNVSFFWHWINIVCANHYRDTCTNFLTLISFSKNTSRLFLRVRLLIKSGMHCQCVNNKILDIPPFRSCIDIGISFFYCYYCGITLYVDFLSREMVFNAKRAHSACNLLNYIRIDVLGKNDTIKTSRYF